MKEMTLNGLKVVIKKSLAPCVFKFQQQLFWQNNTYSFIAFIIYAKDFLRIKCKKGRNSLQSEFRSFRSASQLQKFHCNKRREVSLW